MATKTQRGFAVRCLFCGQEESIQIDAHDLDSLHCSSCDEGFTPNDVRAEIGKWTKLLAWLETAPEV